MSGCLVCVEASSLGEWSWAGDSMPPGEFPGSRGICGHSQVHICPFHSHTAGFGELGQEAEQSAEKHEALLPFSSGDVPEGSCILSLVLEQEDAMVTKFRK